MDKEMRERIRREQQALKKEEIENMKAYFEEWERDPVWMRRREIKKAIFIIIFIFIVFLIFRYFDACLVPDSICDIKYWGQYGKKCYECSIKWIFYQEDRKEKPKENPKKFWEDNSMLRDIKTECWDNTDCISDHLTINQAKIKKCYEEIDYCNEHMYDWVVGDMDWVVEECASCCDIYWNSQFYTDDKCAPRPEN